MKHTDFCLKIKNVVTITNNVCSFDEKNKCPHRNSALCLLNILKKYNKENILGKIGENKQMLQEKQETWILKLKNGMKITIKLDEPITLNELIEKTKIPATLIDEAI